MVNGLGCPQVNIHCEAQLSVDGVYFRLPKMLDAMSVLTEIPNPAGLAGP